MRKGDQLDIKVGINRDWMDQSIPEFYKDSPHMGNSDGLDHNCSGAPRTLPPCTRKVLRAELPPLERAAKQGGKNAESESNEPA